MGQRLIPAHTGLKEVKACLQICTELKDFWRGCAWECKCPSEMLQIFSRSFPAITDLNWVGVLMTFLTGNGRGTERIQIAQVTSLMSLVAGSTAGYTLSTREGSKNTALQPGVHVILNSVTWCFWPNCILGVEVNISPCVLMYTGLYLWRFHKEPDVVVYLLGFLDDFQDDPGCRSAPTLRHLTRVYYLLTPEPRGP